MIKPLTPSSELPLFGKRILISAPRNHASRLAQHLTEQGALPLLMPTIETCRLTNYSALDAALRELRKFHWIAFTSRNGIDAWVQRWQELELEPSRLVACQICALGMDAERLRQWGMRADIVPKDSSPEGIVQALAQMPNVSGKEVLVPVPRVMGIPEPSVIPNFINRLKEIGLRVTKVPAYLTRSLGKENYEVELTLLREGKVDVVAFSSTAEVTSFLAMVDSPQDYQSSVLACFGPYTAANAREMGLSVDIVAKDYSSFEKYGEAIAAFFS